METFLNPPSQVHAGTFLVFPADFAVFEYDLLEQCQQEPLQTIVADLRE